ncbi:MAG TPA: hypothetical protein VFM61_09015 [Pseudidiomarina sp.]|nr:hypothetical protein [Pseudidiomarina sp.]
MLKSNQANGLHLADYWRWLRKHVLLTVIMLSIGVALSWTYWQQLPRLYQAQALLRIDPIAYNQGMVRKVDDLVLNQTGAAFAQPATTRPEARIAFYFSGAQFQADVAQHLATQFAPQWDAVDAALQAYGTTRHQQIEQYVARHLHTFRNAIDGGHGVQWYFYDPATAQQQLEHIIQLLDDNLRQVAINELTSQLQALASSSAADSKESAIYAEIESVLLSRLQIVQSPEFSILHRLMPAEVSSSPRYPNRIPVLAVGLITWCALWFTILNGYLLRHAVQRNEVMS